jgi:hypothetical protein
MTTIEKRSNTQRFTQDYKRNDKDIDEIEPVIEFCTMPDEMQKNCIIHAKNALSKLIHLYIMYDVFRKHSGEQCEFL